MDQVMVYQQVHQVKRQDTYNTKNTMIKAEIKYKIRDSEDCLRFQDFDRLEKETVAHTGRESFNQMAEEQRGSGKGKRGP